MSFERMNEIENYFKEKKNISSYDLNLARSHMEMLTKEMSIEELKNAKIFYQSQLSTSSMIGNYFSLMAIIVSLFACLISIITLYPDTNNSEKYPFFNHLITLYVIAVLIYSFLMSKMRRYLKKTSKKHETYTIIISLLDDVLE